MKKEDKPHQDFWLKRMENGWRMWVCPRCGGKLRGNYYEKDINPYRFCPFCGKKLGTKLVWRPK